MLVLLISQIEDRFPEEELAFAHLIIIFQLSSVARSRQTAQSIFIFDDYEIFDHDLYPTAR
jgi:hypothetical protein